ncbi:MAG: MliC family protein [Hyphomicrobiales bacterium]
MRNFISSLTLLLFALTNGAVAETKPTFDCAKAESSAEELICKNEELAALDQKMGKTFKAALAGLKGASDEAEATKMLKATQRGWIKGRDECWKANDLARCVRERYELRIAEMEARYILLTAGAPKFFSCEGNPANEISATFFDGALPSVRLERGDKLAIGVLAPSGSGARYIADFGISFWLKGDEAQVTWPEGNSFSCSLRK